MKRLKVLTTSFTPLRYMIAPSIASRNFDANDLHHQVADFFKKIDPVKDMVDPIVNGVIELLKACFKESSVKSVINISSVSTMTNPLGNPEIRRFTADDYIPVDVDVTDLNILVVYGVAKARAEKMALQMMAEQKSCHFRLNSVVLPSVIGPLPEPEFQAGLRGEVVNKTSIEFIFSVVKREMGDDVRLDRWIDVRDLVTTLGNLLTAEHVNGNRFMLHADEPFDPPKVAEMLRENFDWAKEVIPDGHPRIDTFWEMDTKPLKDAVGISAKYDLKQSALESIEQAWKLGQVEIKNSV